MIGGSVAAGTAATGRNHRRPLQERALHAIEAEARAYREIRRCQCSSLDFPMAATAPGARL